MELEIKLDHTCPRKMKAGHDPFLRLVHPTKNCVPVLDIGEQRERRSNSSLQLVKRRDRT